MLKNIARRRAMRGAELLDARHEVTDWYNGVDTDKLDMECVHHCALGQLAGHYDTGRRRLGLTNWQAAKVGFIHPPILPKRLGARYYDHLTEAWRAEITKRRMLDIDDLVSHLRSENAAGRS